MALEKLTLRTILVLGMALAVATPPVWAQDEAKPEEKKTEQKKTQEKKKSKDPKKDVDAIGERNVGKGMNWYSIEKEMRLGKGSAQEFERLAKIVDDPVMAE